MHWFYYELNKEIENQKKKKTQFETLFPKNNFQDLEENNLEKGHKKRQNK